MKFLSYVYRFTSNFIFLSVVYFSLNFMEKYQNRAIVMNAYIDLLFLSLVMVLCISKIVTN
jgi:hypothetical protein